MKKTDEERRAEIEKLRALIEKGLSEKSLLSQMELAVEEEKRQLGQRRMDEKLDELGPEDGKPRTCPKCGAAARVRAKNVMRVFKSLSGVHTFRRHYHYCENCKEGFYPRDAQLGLPKDSEVSTEVAKRLADFYLNDPFEVAEQRWPVHYPFMPASANQFRQDAERLGEKLETADEAVLASALQSPSTMKPDVLYVQNDGAMVSMQNGEWSEVKSAVVFTDDKHLKGTDQHRGEIADAHYVSVLGDQTAFTQVLKPTLQVMNAMRAAVVVWLADGARGNWVLASKLFPRAIQILDWFHAVEHASDCAKLLLGEGDPCVGLFVQRIEHLLLTGQVKQCIRELQAIIELAPSGAPLKALTELIGYYQQHQRRMRYDEYLAQGFLIGSGPIESAHRHVIQRRMKQAGQHWGQRGGRRMARMRAAYRTAGPARFFDAIHWANRETIRNGRLPKPMKRRASNR
jgi:hypothetical protein